MPRIYRISLTGLKLIYKLRHHRGHGIHSPFVFDLVNKVIEEKSEYYVYSDIRHLLREIPGFVPRISKYNRLSFRLVNYFDAKDILELGSGNGVNSLFLTAPFSDSACISIEPDRCKRNLAIRLYDKWPRKVKSYSDPDAAFSQIGDKKLDCIFIDLKRISGLDTDNIDRMSNFLHSKSFIVINNIRSSRRAKSIWADMVRMETRTAMLDLFSVGILFFDTKLYRWDYKISY